MGAAVVAVLVRKEREIVTAYRDAGATNPGAARDPNELGVHQHVAFSRLVRRAVLRDVGGGRYYLDEPSWEALRGMRRRMTVVALVVAIIVLGGTILLGGAAVVAHGVAK